jgi:hypothetical protein
MAQAEKEMWCVRISRSQAEEMYTVNADNWGKKAIRRRTTGTGRTKNLRAVNRKFNSGFCELHTMKARKLRKAVKKTEVKEEKM